ncbi:hypothetical protein TNCV_4977821 [Trichonephila clavipes]|nr:hypothetical protein TNCV_4977821 [Trichonephila clavipes]
MVPGLKDMVGVALCPLQAKNPEGPELAKNGHQHDCQVFKMVTKWPTWSPSCQNGHQIANLIAKNDTNLALAPGFSQVPIESPL